MYYVYIISIYRTNSAVVRVHTNCCDTMYTVLNFYSDCNLLNKLFLTNESDVFNYTI